MTRIKIMVISAGPSDGTSFYRCYGALYPLIREHPEIEIIRRDNLGISWVELLECDIVFMQRPCTSSHVKLAEYAKNCGRQLWIDYDDLLWELPPSNPTFATYAPMVENMTALMNMADVITATTETLKNAILGKINGNDVVNVIPNAYNPEIMGPIKTYPKKNPVKTLVWRGSPTHYQDIEAAYGTIISLINKHKYGIIFFGMDPSRIFGVSPQIVYQNADDIIRYFAKMYAMNCNHSFVALRDDHFNRCKSTIAWMEATISGKICAMPHLPEWEGLPGARYDSSDEIAAMVELPLEEKARMHEEAVARVMSDFQLKYTNRIRYQIINALME